MKALGAGWQALAARIDALSLRERVLILAAAVALAWAVGVLGLLQPLWQRAAAAERDLARGRDEARKTEAQIAEARQLAASDPDEATRARIAALRAELAALDERFAALEKTLVQPQQMVQLLERVLRRGDGRVRIVAVRSLGATPLVEAPAQALAGAAAAGSGDSGPPRAEAGGSPLHRHGVEIRLAGGYLDLLQYLTELERVPSRMYFSRAVLDASDPAAVTLTVSIYTVSIGREWMAI